MPVIFLDTSAFLKLYLAETGATWLRNYVTGQQIAISELALFEIANVARRLYTENIFTRDEALDLTAQANRNSIGYRIVTLGSQAQLVQLTNLIFSVLVTLRIRSLDSIHLTATQIALEDANSLIPPEPFVFVSSDVQLLRVAQAMGISTENPEDHP